MPVNPRGGKMHMDRFRLAENKGVGRGFYLQMAGFAAGRLQTGGRGCCTGRGQMATSSYDQNLPA